MFRLRTLGETRLIGPDGQAAESLIGQSKRFSLLVYLAAARPSGLHRRDSIVAMFWPESTDRRARGALSQSLHLLRGTLGDAVITRGREEVGIDPELVSCDARTFRLLIEEGTPAEALAEYRGELLPGFHLVGARGFEEWLERERRHLSQLAREAVDAAVQLEEQRGNTWGAIRLLYGAVERHPTDEPLIQRLIELLSLAGDRPGALDAFERFRRRLDEEYGLDVTSRTTALVERLLRDPAPPADRATPEGSTRSVAVLPLGRAEQGPGSPGPTHLAPSMTDALITELSGATDLRVVSYTSVASLGGRHPPREVGSALGVDAVVYGSVRSTPESVRIQLQLVDTKSEVILWNGVKESQPSDVRSLYRSLARAIAAELGEREKSRSSVGRLPDRVDPSAYNEYLRGLFFIMSGEYHRVLPHLEAAVRGAPELAEAYVFIAMIHGLHVVAGASPPMQSGERMLEAAQRAVTLDPHSGHGYHAMGGYHMLIDRDWDAAGHAFERGDARGMDELRAGGWRILFLAGQGRLSESLARGRELLYFDPIGGPTLRWGGPCTRPGASKRPAPSSSGPWMWHPDIPGRYRSWPRPNCSSDGRRRRSSMPVRS